VRTRHVALALGLTAALTVVPVRTLVPPAAADVSPTTDRRAVMAAMLTPSARAFAVGLEQGVLESESLVTSAAIADSPLAGFPTEGSTFTLLTTGDAMEADDPATADVTSTRDDDLGTDWDTTFGNITRLRLELEVADNATCLTFDYKFLTEEYGEATVLNDRFFAALLEDPSGPLASARQFLQNNSSVPALLSPAAAAGTPYDAATATIRAAVPIPSPRLGLTFTIEDGTDGIADSAVFLDNLQAGTPIGGTCSGGVALDHHEVTITPRRASPAVGTEQQVAVELRDHSLRPAAVAGAPLVVERAGAHPGTQRLVSGSPSATTAWTGTSAGVDTVTACWDTDGSGTCGPGEVGQTRAARVTWTDGRRPRIAFTDDTDTVAAVRVTRDDADRLTTSPAPIPWAVFSEHSGELSAMDGDLAGISTQEEETGEVYLRADGGSWVRVTCDAYRETHPAVHSPRNLVAYASDADGDWDIYVAYRAGSFASVPRRVASTWMLRRPRAAAVAAAETSTCPGTSWTHVNLTETSASDDLWPAWGPDGTLVWSSTTDDPLGDLYSRTVNTYGVWGPVRRLTNDPAADTQPAVGLVEGETFVAFTTTRYAADGSIAALRPAATDEVTPLVPVWEGPTSQATWSGPTDVQHLAWTSRDDDPDGDVHAARVTMLGTSEPTPLLGTPYPVSARPGVAETHPAWVEDIGQPDEPGTVAFTTASLPADVADVHAEDGADRRVLASRDRPTIEIPSPRDEGAPAYSPGGARLVYSSELTEPWPVGSGSVDGHELLVMGKDGDGNTSLASRTGRRRGDTDVDPAWSHDGSRLAWTRYAAGSDVPEVWVADLDAGTAWPATRPRPGLAFADVTASWSPDDEWLVVARNSTLVAPPPVFPPEPNAAPIARVAPRAQPRNTVLTLLRPDGSGDSITLTRPPSGTTDGTPVLAGRSPAWSPDGARIAYARGPQLEVVELPAATPTVDAQATGTWQVAAPRVLVGFEQEAGGLVPTVAREVLEAGDDPDWSPDGERLAFSGRPAGQPDLRGLYTIGADGADLTLVTDDRGPETEPAWQPREADVGVTVAVTGTPALVGAPVTATFTITNHGPGYASAVSLAATYGPGATTAVSTPPPGCVADGTGCAVPVLAPGASFDYTVSVAHPAPVSAAARGTVSTTAADPVAANDSAEAPYDVVPLPPGPTADVAVTVAVGPTRALVGNPLQATFTVSNLGPSTAESVNLSTGLPAGGTVAADAPPAGCAADGSGCALASLAPGASTTYVVDLSYPAPVTGEVTATALSATPDPQLGNNTASAPIEVIDPPPEADLAVTVTLDGPTGWVGGRRTATVVVRNKGPEAAADARVKLSFPDVVEVESSTPEESTPACEREKCSLGTVEPGARLVWTVVLIPNAAGVGAVTGSVVSTTVDPELENNAARERLTVLQPRVSVLPGVSRPGKAVLAFGEDMPPDSEVVLSWTKGIMTAPGPYVVEPDGTFTQPVFLVRRDQLGRRRLTVQSATDDFSPVRARLLVTYPTMLAVGDIVDRG
jgi:hypothetical protein